MRLEDGIFVTGNRDKLEEAERILGQRLRSRALDLPEIQSLDLRVVLEAKAEEAWRRVGEPVLVEETGLELSALGGFPGPLVKWMLEAVGPEGISRTAQALGDDVAIARCAVALFDGRSTLLGEGSAKGRLVLPSRGPNGFGWDPVFVADGETRTYGELESAAKDRLGHRGRAWRALLRAVG